jgi:Ca-activated chloride channel family protein
MTFDFDPNNNSCIIYLEKQVKDTISKNIERKTIVKKDTIKEEIFVYKPVENVSNDFNSTRYKPNHLIFVIDISGSMKDSVKLGFLKESIKALIGVLRPQDYITLITYANKPKVVFENENGLSKEKLNEAIDSLHAKGASVGSEALIMAYNIAKQHFIEGGNNQIFLATDGLFNGSSMDEKDLYKIVKNEYVKNEVKLTTIAFGKNIKAIDFLSGLAFKGNGQSLAIVKMPADKEILIEEVKAQSLK